MKKLLTSIALVLLLASTALAQNRIDLTRLAQGGGTLDAFLQSGSLAPQWRLFPDCHGANNALTYNTTTHLPGCNTISGGGGGGLSGTQFSSLYMATSSSAGYATPPTTKGTYFFGYNLTTDAAAAPAALQVGFTARTVSGASDTILYSDLFRVIEYTDTSAVAVTLPTATTLENAAFATDILNASASAINVTVTPTTWTINGNSSLVITQGQICRIFVSPAGSAWQSTCFMTAQPGGGSAPEINYLDFCAADPNFGTDDTPCWQAAEDAVSTPGQTIVAPNGHYKITDTLLHSGIGFHVRAAGTAGGGPGVTIGSVILGCATSQIVIQQLGATTGANYGGAEFDGVTFQDITGGHTCAGGVMAINQSYVITHGVGYSGFSQAATPAPSNPTPTPSGTGGHLAPGVHVWAIADADKSTGRETLPSTPVSTTVGGSGLGSIALTTHTAASPMTTFNIYEGTSATTMHLVSAYHANGTSTITDSDTSGVAPVVKDHSASYGINTFGTSGNLGTVSTGYANQNDFYDTQSYNNTVNAIVADRNVSGTLILGGNLNGGTLTDGCGMLLSGEPTVFMHTESGHGGWVRACPTGPEGEMHINMDIGAGTQTGIEAINAWHWNFYVTCGASSGTQTPITLDARSNGNEVHIFDDDTCGPPLITNLGTNNSIWINGVFQATFASRTVSGTTDTVALTDNQQLVEYSHNGSVAVALPTPTTLLNSGFSTTVANTSAGATNVTVTPATFQINGSSTLVVAQHEVCHIYVDQAGSSWHALCNIASQNP